MESLVNLANSVLEKLMNATIEQSRYICCFTSIAEDFKKEKKTVEGKVERAKRKGDGINPDVTQWLEQVDALMKDDTKTRMTCFFGRCPNCKRQYSTGKELENKTKEIKSLLERNSGSVGVPRGVAGVEYHSSQNYISFKSRESKRKELLDALTDDNNYMTGLQGMGGTGKTTLAIEVGKELNKSKKFDKVIDTVVSYTLDIKKIQDDIAGPLEIESWKGCIESERPKRLWERLTNGEKILIILDDVWGHINFEEIGIPFKDNHNGCRILVTTRDLRICNSMGCDKIIQLELLPEEDAWILFKNHAGLSGSSSKTILDKGRKIAKECKGLPIAIAAIASSLKGQQRHEEWKVALESLQKSTPLHADDEILGKIYKCLWYSYDNMQNNIAKGLFLLCSLFREDAEISDVILTRLSIGAGLLGEIDDNYDAGRNKVVVAKRKLIDSCLLLETEEESVKMHDLVREVALRIANKEIQAVNLSNKNQKSLVERAKNLKYLQCEGNVFSFRFDGSKLEILIVNFDEDTNGPVEVPNSFFENMTRLQVLYLSTKNWCLSLSFPQSIQSLTNIRSLILESFNLGDMSILRSLQGLKTLDLVDCSMDELPREIAELEKLKLLSLDDCTIERNNPFKVIESCSSLEELYFIGSFLQDSSTMHQKVKLPKLLRFRIVDDFIPDQPGRNCLSVPKVDDFFFEATLKHLLQTTEYLHLYELQWGWRNLIPEIIMPEHEGTLNLVVLCLKSISQLECLIDTKHIDSRVQNVFSKLIELRLEEMENLKELCSGPLPFELLKSLEKLRIRYCIHLEGLLFKSKLTLCNLKSLSLYNCPMLTSLFPLSTMSIKDCEQLKSIITDERTREDLGEEIVDGDNDNKNGGSMFPNLKTLDIAKCPQLDFILPLIAARDVPKLEVIHIWDCEALKYIFGGDNNDSKNGGSMFPNLKTLEIAKCPHLDFILSVVAARDVPKLEVIQIWDCEALKYIFGGGNNDNKNGGSMFPNLKFLDIRDCPQLDFILPVVVARDVTKLEDITIQNCEVLKYIFGPYQHKHEEQDLHQELKDVIFVPLKNVALEGLPNFVDIFPECDQSMCSSVKSSCSKDASKSQIESDPIKCNIFPWTHKYRHKDQLQDCSLSSVHDSEVNDVIGQEMTMALENIQLSDMTCLFVGPSNYFTLQNITVLIIEECEKMKVILSASMFGCLPQLHTLGIYACKELKQIIDEDTRNQTMSSFLSPKTFFPRLKVLVIRECNNLKCVFPISTSKILPKLEVLVIREASMLEEVFGCDSDQKVEIPSLKIAVFVELPSLCQGTEFQIVKDHFVQNCPKLSLTSTSTLERIRHIFCSSIEGSADVTYNYIKRKIQKTLDDLSEDSEAHETSNQNTTAKATEDFPIETKVQAASGSELISSQVNTNQSTHVNIAEYNQYENDIESNEFISLETQTKETLEAKQEFVEKVPGLEIPSRVKSPTDSELIRRPCRSPSDIPQYETHSLCLKEIEDQSTQEGSMLEKTQMATPSTHRKMGKILPGPLVTPLQKEIQRSVEEGTTSAYGKTVASSIGSELEDGEGQIALSSFSEFNIEPATTKDVGDGYFQKTSKSVITPSETNAQGSDLTNEYIKKSLKETLDGLYKDSEAQETSNHMLDDLYEHSKARETSKQNPTANAREEFPIGTKVQEASGSELTSLQVNTNQSIHANIVEYNQHESDMESNKFIFENTQTKETLEEEQEFVEKVLGIEIPLTAKSPTHSELIRRPCRCPLDIPLHETQSHCPEEIQDQSIQEGSMSEKSLIATLSTHPKTRETSLEPLFTPPQKGIKRSFEEGTTSAFAETIALSTGSESEHGEGQIVVSSFSIVNRELATTKDVSVGDIQETSKSMVTHFRTNAPEILSQITGDSGFVSIVTRELEQLVSNKHLALENLSLLTNFLMKHPSVHLTDNAVSNRYKGFAYTCLAELLKFLQTHSVLDILGSSHSEFVQLLEDVRRFGFNRDWLNNVERRALFRGLQMSEEALQKLLDSKHALIQHMDDLKHKLEEQEALVLEVKAKLSTPLGY